MRTFSPKTRELALRMSNGYCQCSPDCVEKVTEFHHKLPNTQVNQKLYPLFLHSIFNCCPIAHGCHMNKPKPRISAMEAAAFEEFLQTLKGK